MKKIKTGRGAALLSICCLGTMTVIASTMVPATPIFLGSIWLTFGAGTAALAHKANEMDN